MMRRRMTRKWAAPVVLALCAGALSATVLVHGPAGAHGEYDWIRQHDYRDLEGFRCCGVEDCHRLPPEALRKAGEGWAVEFRGSVYVYPPERVFGSEDGDIWACISETISDRRPRCLFVPRML